MTTEEQHEKEAEARATVLRVLSDHPDGIDDDELRDVVEEITLVDEIDFDAVVAEISDEGLIQNDENGAWHLVEVSS